MQKLYVFLLLPFLNNKKKPLIFNNIYQYYLKIGTYHDDKKAQCTRIEQLKKRERLVTKNKI